MREDNKCIEKQECFAIFLLSVLVLLKMNLFFVSMFAIANAILFTLLFSLSLTCDTSLSAEEVREARSSLALQSSFFSFTLCYWYSYCSDLCSISAGLGLLSSILLVVALQWLMDYGD